MLDLGEVLNHWGYVAVFLLIILGNVGLPIPEESILAAAGYLVWRGQLRFSVILILGIVGAAAGDNLGYWIGRRYGRVAVERYSRRLLMNPERLQTLGCFVMKHGFLGVFAARFIPGLRFLASPLAGAAGLPVRSFVMANMLGALAYVPYVVGIGYAVGYGLGTYVERVRHVVGEVEAIILITVIILGAALMGWRLWQVRHPSRKA